MKIITLILLFCRFCTCEYSVNNGGTTKIRRNTPRTQLNRETGPRQPPPISPPGATTQHASRPGLNVQRSLPPRSGGLMETTTRGTLPGAKPTGTQTAVGKSTIIPTVNSKPSTRPVIEDIGEDLEEDLKHVKAYHEIRHETINTTPEVTSTTVPKEQPLEYKMDMTLITVGKSTEGTLSVVTYTAKQDANIPLLLHNNKLVWKSIDSMNNKDTLVKAKVYLGFSEPLAANLTYKRVTESTTREYCKLVKDKWTFVDKSALERTFDEVGELPGNANASAYRTKVDSTLFDVEVGKHNGIPTLNCTAKKGVKVPKLVYDGNVVWQADGNQFCSSATFYFGKSGIIGISFTYDSREETLHDCFRVFSNDEWEGVNGDYYEKVLYETKNPEASVATASENTKAKSFIDTAKFTVVSDMENGVPVLRCTAGNGASKLTYGSDTIWPGKKDVTCLSAILYLDGDQPTLAVLVTRDKNNKQNKVYRYHDGKQWKDGKEEGHKKNLDALKTKAKNRPIAKHPSAQLAPQQGVQAKPEDAPVKTDGQTPQKKPQANAQPATQPDQKSTQPSKRAPVKEIILDIGKPDPQSYKSFDYALDDVPTRLIVAVKEQPNKVVFGQETLWSDDTGRCNYCTVHMKDKKPVLVYISGRSFSFYLLKTDGGWKSIDNYSEEFAKLRLAVPSPSSFSLDISTNQDTGQCRIFETPFNKVNTRFYVPKAGKCATSVSNGQAVLWKGGQEKAIMVRLYPSDNPTLLHILSKDTNGAFKHNYLVKSANKWESINKDVHDRLLSEIKATAPGKNTDVGRLRQELIESQASLDKLVESMKFTDCDGPKDPSILDIVHYEESNAYTVSNCTLDGYPTTVFIPDKGSIKKVVYGTLTIWEGAEKEECKYLMVHYVYNIPAFAYLIKGSDKDLDLYFANKGDNWEEIQVDYINKLNELRRDRPASGDYVIDIKNTTSSEKCKVYSYIIDGLLTYSYYPYPEVTVKKIMEGNINVWNGGGRCLYLAVSYVDSKPVLAYFVKLDGYKLEYTFYKRDKDKWSNCYDYVYRRKWNNLINKKDTSAEDEEISDMRQERLKKVAHVRTIGRECILDIKDISLHETYRVIKTFVTNIPAVVYIPGPTFNFNTIKDQVNCNPHLGEQFKGVYVFMKDNELSVIYISRFYNNSILEVFYDLNDAKIIRSADVEALESYKHSKTVFSLDISRRGTDECKFVSFHNDGVLTHTHVVNAEYIANMVTDGVILLWRGDKGEKCLYSLTSFLDNTPILLNIFVRLSDGKLEHYYFYNSGEWTVINTLDYKGILRDLAGTTKSKLSESVERDTREVLTLDVAKVDTSKYTMETTRLRVLTSIKYSPPEDARVTKVLFGNDSLWQTLKAGAQCKFAVITYRGISIELAQLCIMDGCEKYMHFEMEDGRLSSITAEEYNDALSRLDSGDGGSDEDLEFIISTIDTLDLITPAEVDFEIDRFQLDTLSSAVYLPLPKHTIGRVVLGKVLWTNGNSKCLYVSTFSTEESIQLVQIVTEDGTLHFARLDKELVKVPQKKYDELFEKLGYRQVDQTPFYVPLEVPDAPNTISLDVSKALDSRVKTENGTFKGVSYATFYTTDDDVIDEISSGKLTVWKPEDDEVCVYGRLYLDNGPKLLKIRTVGKDGSNIVHLALDTDKWICLSQDVFNDKLNLMVLKLTEPLRFALTTTTDGYYEYTFDLSRYHIDSRFNSGFMTYGGHKYAVCTPKNGVIKKVVQGNITIWTPSSDDYYANMVLLSSDTHLYILVQSPFNIPAILSYHLKNNIWHMVNHEAISTDITKTLPIPSFRLTLDLTGKHDPEKYRVFKMEMNGVATTVFITIYGYYFDKVVSGKDLVWQSSENEECRYLMFHDKSGKNSFITVFVDCIDGSKFMVYEMKDKWTFSHQLLGPKNDYKTTTPAVFNLSDKTPQNVYFCDNVFNGIVHRAFSPLPGYHVQEVKDSETTIWQAEDKEQCIFILSVPGTTKSNTSLLSLFVRNEDYCGFKHFEKTDKWRHIDERGYDKRLIEKKQTNNVTTTVAISSIPQYKNAVTLDTANIDHDRVDLHEDSLNGARCLYSAKTGDYFNSLLDSGKTVWKSDKDKCISVAIYGKDELHCSLDVLSSDVITPIYFCRKAGNWSSTNYNTFHEWLRSYVKTPRVKLDLDNLDTNFFESFRYTQNGYEILYGRPLPGYVLTTVADGSTEVWEAGHNQYATEFQMSIIGDYTLLSIINHSYQVENLCFLKSSNSWSPIDEDVYDQYLVPVNDSTINYLKFDLSKPDFSIVVGHKDVMGDITILRYTPHLGRHVTAVVFGESTIWSGHYHDEYCISSEHITKGGAIFIKLLLKMGSSFEHRYFTKIDNRWVTLKEDEFKNKLGIQSVKIDAKSTLQDGGSDPNVYTLNISGTVDRDKITATETIYEEVKSVTYSPKFTAGIGKVVDSDGIVWMGTSDQKCVTAVISSKDGYDPLVSISINIDTEVRYKYLVKKNKEWYLIRKTKYDELLFAMYRHSLVTHADTTFDNPITLDLSTKSTEGVTFYEYTHNEVTYKTFKPKDDKSVVEIVDGKSVLWKSSSGKCIDAWTYSTPFSHLCRLDILSSGVITPHCFEKRGSLWISLDFKLYTEKLKKLISYNSAGIKLDLLGLSMDTCTILSYVHRGLLTTSVIYKLSTNSVYYRNTVWESKEGKETLASANFHTNTKEDICMVTLKDQSESLYFWRKGTVWDKITQNEFHDFCDALRRVSVENSYDTALTDIALDTNKVDREAFRTYNYSDSTVTNFEYFPLENNKVTKVISGTCDVIWQGDDKERCLSCKMVSKAECPPIVVLIIRYGEVYGFFSHKYFERVDSGWNEITEETFNLRLTSLYNNSRLQLLKDRLVDTSENSDVFDRKASYTSEEINMLYLNQWLLSHTPHWVLDQFKTFYPEKGWFSSIFSCC
ncbi:hypothetical protein BEWA_017110 [Theileria equi strain WA]|uniref:SfiI-subtelomeric related protein family member n=1 Tax=Theileria equi strain WA TaxID=1537102 RepID=L1L9E4_THEEQ|nr:hypothetical protein BEWA_017110 [Theileria equi strain WA]EKX72032.1 hypothetical protein BEWA_017110 [Theileria equi strain WA]|eukprot:XP_004831484.1 hypothetical protein BEWA_017110 [Theileria equi strain WA]